MRSSRSITRIRFKRTLFDILRRSSSVERLLVNIDRNEDGSIAERLVKRAVGLPEELVRFVDGNMESSRVHFV